MTTSSNAGAAPHFILRVARALLASFALVLLVACSHPVPPDRAAYVGEWAGAGMELHIEHGGQVYYKRVTNHTSRTINMPLLRFEGANFVVGFGPFTTTFVVSVPPHESDGAWLMTVDGVELTRRSGTGSSIQTTRATHDTPR